MTHTDIRQCTDMPSFSLFQLPAGHQLQHLHSAERLQAHHLREPADQGRPLHQVWRAVWIWYTCDSFPLDGRIILVYSYLVTAVPFSLATCDDESQFCQHSAFLSAFDLIDLHMFGFELHAVHSFANGNVLLQPCVSWRTRAAASPAQLVPRGVRSGVQRP